MAVEEEHHRQLHQIDQHVQRAEADGDDVRQAVGEALVGIHAKQASLEEADADAGEQHARRRQHHAQGQLVVFRFHMYSSKPFFCSPPIIIRSADEIATAFW